MAHACRVLYAFLLAVVVARAGMTIKWNTQPSPAPPATVENARVAAVHGTSVVLRLQDGTMRTYTTTPQQARDLQALIGTIIRFRLH